MNIAGPGGAGRAARRWATGNPAECGDGARDLDLIVASSPLPQPEHPTRRAHSSDLSPRDRSRPLSPTLLPQTVWPSRLCPYPRGPAPIALSPCPAQPHSCAHSLTSMAPPGARHVCDHMGPHCGHRTPRARRLLPVQLSEAPQDLGTLTLTGRGLPHRGINDISCRRVHRAPSPPALVFPWRLPNSIGTGRTGSCSPTHHRARRPEGPPLATPFVQGWTDEPGEADHRLLPGSLC